MPRATMPHSKRKIVKHAFALERLSFPEPFTTAKDAILQTATTVLEREREVGERKRATGWSVCGGGEGRQREKLNASFPAKKQEKQADRHQRHMGKGCWRMEQHDHDKHRVCFSHVRKHDKLCIHTFRT